MTIPASAGPMTRPRFHCADDSAIAPGSSWVGTRSGSIAWNDGKPIADAQPAPNTMSVTTAGLGVPMLARNARRPAKTICTAVVASSRVRRGTRSASAPANGASTA